MENVILHRLKCYDLLQSRQVLFKLGSLLQEAVVNYFRSTVCSSTMFLFPYFQEAERQACWTF